MNVATQLDKKMKTQGKQLIRIRGDVGYSGVVNAHRQNTYQFSIFPAGKKYYRKIIMIFYYIANTVERYAEKNRGNA